MEKVPVSTKALLQRINRKLAHDTQVLKKVRSARVVQRVGRYYIVDTYNNLLLHTHCVPEVIGREKGVLAAWERVE